MIALKKYSNNLLIKGYGEKSFRFICKVLRGPAGADNLFKCKINKRILIIDKVVIVM